MEWAFYENPHHFIEQKSFIFWHGNGTAWRNQSQTRLTLTPTRKGRRLRRQRGALALLATEGRFISPRGVCFSTIAFSFLKELQLVDLLQANLKQNFIKSSSAFAPLQR